MKYVLHNGHYIIIINMHYKYALYNHLIQTR